MRVIVFTFLFIIYFSVDSFSQTVSDVSELDEKHLNWYNKDLSGNGIFGTSVDRAYKELLKNKLVRKIVVVAVIDGGVDIDHVDLQGQIWLNEDEIDGNGLDDDGNGYIDDMHGWNFIGNVSGENIMYEHLEYVRILKTKPLDYPDRIRAQIYYDKEYKEQIERQENLRKFEEVFSRAKSILFETSNIQVTSLMDLKKITPNDDRTLAAFNFLKGKYESGLTEEALESYIQHNNDYLQFRLNQEKDFRTLVGDNPEDITDTNYGNPDVKGPRANHGTSVAGIIASLRGNGSGIDGIASNVKIMAIRTTPDGDERDKDVALAIRYAVDNGADIINMSFGKGFSPQKVFVDEAVKYAEERGVLLVHASGNDAENLEKGFNFPTAVYNNGVHATNWVEIGASSELKNLDVAASFSNYGSSLVDIFAPGVNIISLDTANTYSMNDGTSLSAPVVSGIAALILSYYPDLSVQELISVILDNMESVDMPKKVYQPGKKEKRKKVKFSSLCVTGGVINAYQALVAAENIQRASQ